MYDINLSKLKAIIPKEIVYKKVDGKELRLYVFPPKQKVNGCVINFHGGGWRAETPKRLFPHSAYFSENGGIGICVEYRLHDVTMGYDVRQCLEDCVDALVFIREYVSKNYGEIPITVLGDSAGGYLAVCLGCQTIIDKIRLNVKRADFVVDLNGIVDLTGKWNYAIDRKPDECLDAYTLQKEYSPLFNVTSNDAPVLIIHGDSDEIVAIEDSQAYLEELESKGIKSQLKILKNARHAFILFDYEHDNRFVADVLGEIAEYLKENKLV